MLTTSMIYLPKVMIMKLFLYTIIWLSQKHISTFFHLTSHPCYSVCIPQGFTDICHVFIWLSQTHIPYILNCSSFLHFPSTNSILVTLFVFNKVYITIIECQKTISHLISDSLHLLEKKTFLQLHCVTPRNHEPSIACMRTHCWWTNVKKNSTECISTFQFCKMWQNFANL